MDPYGNLHVPYSGHLYKYGEMHAANYDEKQVLNRHYINEVSTVANPHSVEHWGVTPWCLALPGKKPC